MAFRKSDMDPKYKKDILQLGPNAFIPAAFDETGKFHHYLVSGQHYKPTRQEAENSLVRWKEKRGLL